VTRCLIPEPCGQTVEPNYAEILVANTWHCNLNCSYCFVGHHLDHPDEAMRPDLASRVVDALDQGLISVEQICIHFYGGEPLLNLAAMRAMVKRAGQKTPGRFSFALTTNGTHATPEVFELLQAGSFYVILSIDGPAPVHDACRRTKTGQPSHARVMDFLEKLKSRTDCQVWGSAVIRSGWRLAQASDYLQTLPVDAVKAQAIRVPDNSPLALSPLERRRYLEDLEAAGSRVIADLEAGRRPQDSRFSSRIFQLLTRTPRQRYCGAGISELGITPDGQVLSCLLLDAHKNRLGHIDEDPSIWIKAGIQWSRARNPAQACGDCFALPLCGGGCPAISPICGDSECEIVRKNCDIAHKIFRHFQDRPEALLGLAGIF